MGRKILFIAADQIRMDALGCHGGRVARIPALDGLAVAGLRYDRAHFEPRLEPAQQFHEGERCDVANDPLQWRNLWDDPGYGRLESDLLADLEDHVPPGRADGLEPVTSV